MILSRLGVGSFSDFEVARAPLRGELWIAFIFVKKSIDVRSIQNI